MEPRVPPVEGGFATRAVTAGLAVPPPTEQRPLAPPIWPAAAWSVDASADLGALLTDERDGYVYGRYDNPTNTALHAVVASLHGAEAAWSTASGTAAIHATLATLSRGGAVLAGGPLYGGTHAQLERMRRDAGWEVDHVPSGEVADRLDPARHRVVHVETIANPTTTVADLGAIAAACRAVDVPLVVDNTFASPYLCRPLELGATVVVESATKYLSGHGDVVAGVVAGSREVVARVREHTYELGASLGPFEAWLVARGIQTLPLRMRASGDNAVAIAEALAEDGREVRYPGLDGHPDHRLASRQFGGRGYGGIVALDLGDRDRAEAFADACTVLARATSLGATRTLVLHPASTSHRQLSREALDAAGVGPGTVRISAGIEDATDLVADVRRALAVADTTGP